MEEIILDDDGPEKKKNGICVPQNLPDGSLMEITKVYPLDAVFDSLEDVPEDIKTNKWYAGSSKWTVSQLFFVCVCYHFRAISGRLLLPDIMSNLRRLCHCCIAESVKEDFGSIDILVHSLANGPEVLAFEAGRKQKVRVNTIAAGPLRSRAAKAIGFIDMMIDYSLANAPLQKELSADEVGNTAAFLASPLASAITGAVIYVDNEPRVARPAAFVKSSTAV
ncbi:Enoyl-[acyl-carrier-protein] reductase [NADH], chloroplastic [Capsicum chinense]|nr:Enoyl-[acyl-carrier-protein] reductase [NADH], chloroplastic [Capsicum chinense]